MNCVQLLSIEPVAFAYISVAAVAGVLFIVLIIMTIIIVTYVVRRKKNKPGKGFILCQNNF